MPTALSNSLTRWFRFCFGQFCTMSKGYSTFSYTVERHFCGDHLVDFAVFSEVEACGMPMVSDSDEIQNSIVKSFQNYEQDDDITILIIKTLSKEPPYGITAIMELLMKEVRMKPPPNLPITDLFWVWVSRFFFGEKRNKKLSQNKSPAHSS